MLTSASPGAIDAVITWVDGDDAAHRARLDTVLRQLGRPPAAAAATRFRSVGEIDFCVASLLRFAPFLRRIHIVTDAQVPPLLQSGAHLPGLPRDKLVLVDHREVFAGFEAHLPTFNSLSIESVLHRVPGLAEHYVYLNDDFMLLRRVQPEDWFVQGQPVLRGQWRRQPQHGLGRRLRRALSLLTGQDPTPNRAGYRDMQAAAARVAGLHDRYFHAGHHPHPQRRSTLARHFEQHPEQLLDNLRHRLRDPRQFLTPSLADHLELQAGTALTSERSRLAYLKPASTRLAVLQHELAATGSDADKLFLCIQSLDEASPEAQRLMLDWLAQVIAPNAIVTAPAGLPADEANAAPAASAQSFAKS